MNPGVHELLCYDAIGRRDKRFGGQRAAGYLAAEAEGDALIASGDIASYRIMRELKNSLDYQQPKWGGK